MIAEAFGAAIDVPLMAAYPPEMLVDITADPGAAIRLVGPL
jgi:hypothetical protein